jgi:hypothetical protein
MAIKVEGEAGLASAFDEKLGELVLLLYDKNCNN